MRARIPPLILVAVGLALTARLASGWLSDTDPAAPTWWAWCFLLLMAIAMLALAAAVTIDPTPILLRSALAGSALAWLVIIAVAALFTGPAFRLVLEPAFVGLVVLLDGAAIAGLVVMSADDRGEVERVVPLERLGAAVAFAVAILMAAGAAVVTISVGIAAWRGLSGMDPVERLPWGAFAIIIAVPPLAFALASFASRRAAGGTFYAQAAANRRNAVLLLVAMIGIVAATVEIIVVSLTFDALPALWAAGIAIVIGIGAAVGADQFGSGIVLDSAGARRADPGRDAALLDVVRELAVAANIPPPTVYIIEDGSENAFATGRDPSNASIAVTRGLLTRMDREELQGVIGHELGHVRNLDTRYALYIAVFVGLVAIVTDGFLRSVIKAWTQGAFFWKGSGKGALGTVTAGLLVGLFLLIVAALLRVFAPLFSMLVQAATSREREFLADATSVEFTRNPKALERALTTLARDTDTLEAANRGTQHLWFRNPVKAGSDRRSSLLSTHPSLGARIDRLRVLQGLDPLDPAAATAPTSES